MKTHLTIFACLSSCLIFLACNRGGSEKEAPRSAKGSGSATPVAVMDTAGNFDPDADTNAVPGGTINLWGGPAPKTLNALLDWNFFTKESFGLMFDGLVSLHPTRNEPEGNLAESWTISEDGKTFTFKIHPAARWSDGHSIHAEDFVFFYDVVMNPKNLTSLFRVGLDRFEPPKIIDSLTLQMTAKEVHWSNFWEASLSAFPKHVWEGQDFNQINWEFPVVSGPYRLHDVKKDRSVTLKRREDWWGRGKTINRHKYNFEFIRWKFMEDQEKVIEAFKKGDYDVYPVGKVTIWMNKTDFKDVKKGWVAKQRIFNSSPKGFRGFVFNLRRPQFQDPLLRRALSHLVDRNTIIDKLLYNQYMPLNSYFTDLYSASERPKLAGKEYDPAMSRQLLSEAGYKVGSDGLLAKDGKPLEITFSVVSGTDMRPVNVYLEELKKVGIQAKVDELSWSTWLKRMDKYEFDVGLAAWGGTRLRDPESMWHSRTADQPSSNNVAGVKDAQIDRLIETQKTEMDLDKRNAILKRIDARLNEIMPYILLWEKEPHWLLYWNRYGTPESVYSKFDDEDCITTYWWLDPRKEAALKDAMKSGKGIPAVPGDVKYPE